MKKNINMKASNLLSSLCLLVASAALLANSFIFWGEPTPPLDIIEDNSNN